MKTIVITGTIASGKSTAIQILEQKFAYHIISADKVYHTLFNQGVFDDELKKVFNTVDRVKLRKIIIDDDKARQKLDDITHNKIIDEIKRQIASMDNQNIAIEIPIFDKKHLIKHDYSVFVYVSSMVQMDRLLKKGWSLDEAQKLIDIQSKYERDNDCDYTIVNDGGVELLEEKLAAIIKNLG
ncbi:MAG: dephospho-CoA kinase [Firmicutes bacterium]|nr:dephospho-CoA kinase [Bacillota bacterium]